MANLVPSSVSETATESPAGAAAPAESAGRPAGPPWEIHERPADSHSPRPLDDEPEVARRLRAQYAEISQLAGGLAHEIRNPLSTLTLNLDLLHEDFQIAQTPRDRRALKRVERLQSEVRRLHAILENFLRFARVQNLKLAPADVNALTDELRDFYEPHLASKAIVVRTYFAAGLPPVRLDADLFKQALLNLALNAEHAMPSGGELILTTRHESPWVVLDVIDTGLGMTEEVRARIFDAFYSTRPGGSGLGLPTTRKIVEAHGGFIRVESEPGKGSQFTIALPECTEPVAVDGGRSPAQGGSPPPDPLEPFS